MKTFHWAANAPSHQRGYDICIKNITGPYSFPLHDHRGMCEFIFVREGCLKQKINGIKFNHQGGSLIFIRERDAHYSWGRNIFFVNIAFPLWWFEQLEAITGEYLFSDLLTTEKKIIQSHISPGEQDEVLKKITALQNDASSTAARFRFLNFLTDLLETFFLPPEQEFTPYPPWLNDLLVWINSTHSPLPNVGELSQRSQRTREHLARSFKRFLGLSPSAYLNKQKLVRAARMLQSTNNRIIDISLEAGFESPGYFNRLFKNEYSVTPREYRSKYRGNQYA